MKKLLHFRDVEFSLGMGLEGRAELAKWGVLYKPIGFLRFLCKNSRREDVLILGAFALVPLSLGE